MGVTVTDAARAGHPQVPFYVGMKRGRKCGNTPFNIHISPTEN